MTSSYKNSKSSFPHSLINDGPASKRFFPRHRVPAEMKARTSHLYAQRLSLRKLRDFLNDSGVRVSHVVIWKWIQRVGKRIRDKIVCKRKRRALVVG
ncbi:hypothetical protein AKJ45_03185 [candidate division MSBL1 archaeon SCGC-AAA261F19]|uniref:Transposase n=1 Tax=candidate division MSBL1 archaeon SCGC-AAA261F19 TaxID=1698275 RepID=A0A133V8V0_9EURY|nr:hypothetical protein AKJ45_03185 [candidate division MSBL1 archaeon SCGC-AAA261F19]